MARLVFSMDTLLSSDWDTRASAAGYPVVDTRAEVATVLLVDFSGSTVTKEKRIFNNYSTVGVGYEMVHSQRGA